MRVLFLIELIAFHLFQLPYLQPLFAADYHAIATSFRTVFISGIPHLTLSERNEVRKFRRQLFCSRSILSVLCDLQVRRFIVLIDTLYEHRVKLVVWAADIPSRIFSAIWRSDNVTAFPTMAASSSSISQPPSDITRINTSATDDVRRQYDEVFAFDRALSRLFEMQSESYWRSEWRPDISTIESSTDQ